MHLKINQEKLVKALSLVVNAADKRHSMAVLANIKFDLTPEQLTLTASDSEVELTAIVELPQGACLQAGATTLPARKLNDICKNLPANADVTLNAVDGVRCVVTAAASRFVLGTLPATDFPMIGESTQTATVTIERQALAQLIEKTSFAMAIQDVRFYLTGMLFEVEADKLTTVSTDGHRLALSKAALTTSQTENLQAVLPRKAVAELQRLLSGETGDVELCFGREVFKVSLPFTHFADDPITVHFTARLIDGKYPDYRRVMPAANDKVAVVSQENLKKVLTRVAILSNEKSRGVVFEFDGNGNLEVRANNAEQDEAKETMPVDYAGEAIELSFNAAYMQDVLGVLHGDVRLNMSQANASVLVNQGDDANHQYVIMPMRI